MPVNILTEEPIPFIFIIDYLYPSEPIFKPTMGCYSVYLGDRFIFLLHDRKEYTNDNGVWIVTDARHHKSLLREFPSIRPIHQFGRKNNEWRVLPASSPDFEESVARICKLVLRNDPRIGKQSNV